MKDADVRKLQQSYLDSHQWVPGRVAPSKKDKPSDVTTKGVITLSTTSLISRWVNGRDFERATHEIWDDSSSDDEE
jgi:hypothetical protein